LVRIAVIDRFLRQCCDRNKLASVSATCGIASFGSRHQPDPGGLAFAQDQAKRRKLSQSADGTSPYIWWGKDMLPTRGTT
jgi:hypothetical protein